MNHALNSICRCEVAILEAFMQCAVFITFPCEPSFVHPKIDKTQSRPFQAREQTRTSRYMPPLKDRGAGDERQQATIQNRLQSHSAERRMNQPKYRLEEKQPRE